MGSDNFNYRCEHPSIAGMECGYCRPRSELLAAAIQPVQPDLRLFTAHEDARADIRAVWALADMLVPPDIQEFGIANKIPELTREIWRSAFVAGWRAALSKEPKS